MARTLIESNLRLLNEPKFCDVTFLVDSSKTRIPGDQLFLKSRSPASEGIFSQQWNEESSREVEIPDVDPATFSAFLKVITYGLTIL